MRSTFAVAALAAIANALPQGGSPTAAAPAGCQTTVPGTFQITVVNLTSSAKRSLERRDTLTLKLSGSVLTDQQGRVGSIVANRQFQFDPAPGQAGAIYTKGFSLCANNSLAIGGSTTFYQCLSGNFYNLYDQTQGAQCTPINIVAVGVSGGSGSTGGASQSVSVRPDGQPNAVTQISDGQIQLPTGKPVTQISDGQVQVSTAKTTSTGRISQISDGQVQAPTSTAKPVSQIGDGQVQAPTGTSRVTTSSTGRPVSQIGDGQVQAPTTTGRPVTQIGDGQVQAPTTTGRPVSQISDGQLQAPTTRASTTTGRTVSQISDGQVQAPTRTSSVVQFTGAAATMGAANVVAAVAGLAAAVAMF